jgi:mannose-1-phosphate guanylyltransferase
MLYAVVMAGGIGERFWPLSTPKRPKQLVPFLGERPLLVKSIERLDPLISIDHVLVVTSRALENPVRELIPDLPSRNLIIEPVGKNTAPAATLATQKVLLRDPGGIVAMFPSDHFVRGREAFQEDLQRAARIAEQDYIVTFGIPPLYPATGYGYIQVGKTLEGNLRDGRRVSAFVEKPDTETALAYIDDGGYFWNSGIFVWSGKFFLEQVREFAPDIYKSLQDIREDLDTGNEVKALERFYGGVKRISVDYAIMERSDRIAVLPASFRWDDMGSWTSLGRICSADENGNVVIGKSILNDVHDSVVYSEEGVVALLGVKDLVIVRMNDVTMVCHRDRVEEVKKLAKEWKSGSGSQ